MAMIDPSPSQEELQNLASLFKQAENGIKQYLATNQGQDDPNYIALTTAAIGLNNAADRIGVMQLHLATDQGSKAVDVINQTTAELQRALIVRAEVTADLSIVKDVVSFAAAIAAGDPGSIVISGLDLYGKLT